MSSISRYTETRDQFEIPIALLLKFRILKFNSYSLDGSGEAVVEAGGQLSSGKTSFTIMLTKFGQNLENLMKPLGIFSCEMQTWHVPRYIPEIIF